MRYDHDTVEFKKFSKDTEEHEIVCRVSLVNKRLIYEGKDAESVKKLVEESDFLEPFLKDGGYPLLARFSHAFSGSRFRASQVIDPEVM